MLRNIRPETKGQKVAALGEGLALKLACRDPEVSGYIVLYGSTPLPAVLATLDCSVLGLYAQNDPHVELRLNDLEAACASRGHSFERHVYHGVYHGFFNDLASNFNVDASRHALVRILSFLLENLAEDRARNCQETTNTSLQLTP